MIENEVVDLADKLVDICDGLEYNVVLSAHVSILISLAEAEIGSPVAVAIARLFEDLAADLRGRSRATH